MEFQLYYTEQGQGTPFVLLARKRRKFGLFFSSNRTFLQDISCDCC